MSSQNPRANSLERLRRGAKALKKERGLKHSEALELVAREAGYHDWHHAQKTLVDAPAVRRISSEEFLELVRLEKLPGLIHDGHNWMRDPITGMRYHSSIRADAKHAKELRVLYNLFTAAHQDVSIWQHSEQERQKEMGRSAALDRSLPEEKRLAGVEKIIQAWYSRSVEAWLHMGIERLYEHPGFNEFACHLWTSTKAEPGFPLTGSDSFWGELQDLLDKKFPPVSHGACKIGVGKSYWDTVADRSAIQTASQKRGVAYGTPLGKNPKFRPARRMPIEAHQEIALHLKSVMEACYHRSGVKNRLDGVRNDLDDWIQKEYSRSELSDDIFFELYYNGDVPAIVGMPAKAIQRFQYEIVSRKIDRVAELLKDHYEDCKPRRRLLGDLKAARASLSTWISRSGSSSDEKIYTALDGWARIHTWFTGHPLDKQRFDEAMVQLYEAVGADASKEEIRRVLMRYRSENPEGLGGKPSDERLESYVDKVKTALRLIKQARAGMRH